MILLLAAAECGVGSYFEDVADRMILFPTEGSSPCRLALRQGLTPGGFPLYRRTGV